ncbi:MAG: RIP metalloprotease RseP, partial [Dehalococcoidia bacterium]|nr:RIP metalloprotease RseP [Dehalococcoidia bacterium]
MLFVLAAVLVFGLLVIIHELGHFFAAKASGIQVLEFGVGFGPKIFKFTRKGTL